jgi:hypothetical protein
MIQIFWSKKIRSGSNTGTIILDPAWPNSPGSDRIRIHNTVIESAKGKSTVALAYSKCSGHRTSGATVPGSFSMPFPEFSSGIRESSEIKQPVQLTTQKNHNAFKIGSRWRESAQRTCHRKCTEINEACNLNNIYFTFADLGMLSAFCRYGPL